MKGLLILITLLMVQSFARAENSVGTLRLEVPLSELLLFDQPGQSCKSQIMDPTSSPDLASMKLVVNYLKLFWKGNSDLRLEYTKIVLTGANLDTGSQTFFFSGQDLSFLWLGSPGVVKVSSSESAYTTAPACVFEVGGVSVRDRGQAITGTGTVFVYGTTDDGTGSGKRVPVSAEASFTFQSAK